MSLQSAPVLLALFFGSCAMALEPEVCDTATSEIDARIASGNHPQQNIAIATQLRDGLNQACAFMDEATLADMLRGLDQILPGGDSGSVVPQQSAAERQAEREVQRAEAAERQAARDARRAEDLAREEAEQNLVSDIARRPPTGRVVKSQLMTRSDTMWGVSIVDWDVYDNRARLLYETWPSREQGQLEEATRHYYVVEFDRSDNIVQHHILESELGRTTTAGLIRGRDEIVLQWHIGRADGRQPTESNLERWSISEAAMIARSPAPTLNGPTGSLGNGNHFQLVTDRGDLLYAASVPLESGPNPKTGVAWMLASPDGEVRDQGQIVHDDETVFAGDWFHSANGSAGLILDITSIGENGIDSLLRPDALQLGSTEVRPVVYSEKRLYVVGGAETGPELPVFQRDLIWLGLENVDQSILISGESSRLTSEAEARYRTGDSPVSAVAAGGYRTAIAPSGVGHAVLITNNLSDDSFPPRDGLWLQEFVSGQPRRDTYLNPDAEQLEFQFNMLVSDGGPNLYVASPKYVMRLNDARELVAYAESSATNAQINSIIADGDSVWLFGEDSRGTASQQQVWLERIQF